MIIPYVIGTDGSSDYAEPTRTDQTKPIDMNLIETVLRNTLRFVQCTGYGFHLRADLQSAVDEIEKMTAQEDGKPVEAQS